MTVNGWSTPRRPSAARIGSSIIWAAISNNRLEELKDGQVSFAYKDYKHEQRHKVMTVSADEFLRRFLLHVLPDSSQRIRHYGLLGNRHRTENLARCRELLAMPVPIPAPERNYRERVATTHRPRSIGASAVPQREDGENRHPSGWRLRPKM